MIAKGHVTHLDLTDDQAEESREVLDINLHDLRDRVSRSAVLSGNAPQATADLGASPQRGWRPHPELRTT